MTWVDLNFGFSTTDVGGTVAALRAVGWIREQPPTRLRVGTEHISVGESWLERSIECGYATASWADQITKLVIRDSSIVFGDISGFDLAVEKVVAVLERVPFTVASFGSLHAWDGYSRAGFGDHHCPHGWAVAFRGSGHDRLVSRRWLATGPWRVQVGENDVTLVQFHDLAAGETEALDQAQPGHRCMGIHRQGGFLQTNYVYRTDLRSLYSKQQKALLFVVKGRDIEPIEMRDAAAARLFRPFGADHRIERVVYVFVDQKDAEAQLPLLWRYGHEVRVISDDGVERRIDEYYEPRPEKPAWVAALDA